MYIHLILSIYSAVTLQVTMCENRRQSMPTARPLGTILGIMGEDRCMELVKSPLRQGHHRFFNRPFSKFKDKNFLSKSPLDPKEDYL
jgi:hypothetical protein